MKRSNEGWGAVLPVIDQQNPIIQYASSQTTGGIGARMRCINNDFCIARVSCVFGFRF